MRLIEEIMKEINGVMDRFDEINLDQAMTSNFWSFPLSSF